MRTALITGAAQGIGLATARVFSQRGWKVYALDVNAELLEKEAVPLGIIPIVCDLANSGEIELFVASINQLDLLVNNAAISAPSDPRELSLEDWNRVMAVNLTAPFLLSRLCASKLELTHGSIINIASTRALMSEPNTEAYSATKGGLLSLTHALSMSLAPVRVNAVSPGWIEHAHPGSLRELDHAFHPAGRVGVPEDIAEMIWYLAGENGGFITGQNFIVDGGITKKMIYPD